jgi:hypothetical protein
MKLIDNFLKDFNKDERDQFFIDLNEHGYKYLIDEDCDNAASFYLANNNLLGEEQFYYLLLKFLYGYRSHTVIDDLENKSIIIDFENIEMISRIMAKLYNSLNKGNNND